MRIRQRDLGGWLQTGEEEGEKEIERGGKVDEEKEEMRQNIKGFKKWERGKERQNEEKWCQSGDPEKTNAGRRKGMMMTQRMAEERRTK